jgi:hypothetical protein
MGRLEGCAQRSPGVAHPLAAAADKGWGLLLRLHGSESQALLRQTRLTFSDLADWMTLSAPSSE